MPIRTSGEYPPRERHAVALDLAACAIALALPLLVVADFSEPLRQLLTLLFTFYVPGRALVANWPRMARWSPVGMSIVFSLGILTLLAMLTLWAGLWHPMPLFFIEAIVSLAGLVAALARRSRARAAAPAEDIPAESATAVDMPAVDMPAVAPTATDMPAVAATATDMPRVAGHREPHGVYLRPDLDKTRPQPVVTLNQNSRGISSNRGRPTGRNVPPNRHIPRDPSHLGRSQINTAGGHREYRTRSCRHAYASGPAAAAQAGPPCS